MNSGGRGHACPERLKFAWKYYQQINQLSMTNKVSAYVDLVKSFYVALTLKSQE